MATRLTVVAENFPLEGVEVFDRKSLKNIAQLPLQIARG